MDADTVLEVDRVCKLFSRSAVGSQKRLAEVIGAAVFGRDFVVSDTRENEFWALKDVSFRLKRGEAIGVLGLNGAGKTTLLRMLNGQMLPDRGEIRIAGKTASMIDLTAGLNDRLSGWENIYLRSASIGRTRKEVDETLDEMVAFMELGDALDAPIGTYSTGMRMRLAFATTIFVEPDLLLIDEVLSVGDFRFRQKCLEKIRSLRERSAFVLASHSMSDIVRFCDLAIVLREGRLVFKGAPDEAVAFYLEETNAQVKKTARSAGGNEQARLFHQDEAPDVDAAAKKPLRAVRPEVFEDNRAVREVRLAVNGREDRRIALVTGEQLDVTIAAKFNRACKRLIFGLTILDDKMGAVSGVASDFGGRAVAIAAPCSIEARVSIPSLPVNPGHYIVYVNIRDGLELLFRSEGFRVEVLNPPHNTFGVFTIASEWRFDVKEGNPA